jgi:hypothetical protein
MIDLPVIFALLMGVAVLVYVVLDGYDLGVGMLLPAAEAREQNIMVSSIGPFWDANETSRSSSASRPRAGTASSGTGCSGSAPSSRRSRRG